MFKKGGRKKNGECKWNLQGQTCTASPYLEWRNVMQKNPTNAKQRPRPKRHKNVAILPAVKKRRPPPPKTVGKDGLPSIDNKLSPYIYYHMPNRLYYISAILAPILIECREDGYYFFINTNLLVWSSLSSFFCQGWKYIFGPQINSSQGMCS